MADLSVIDRFTETFSSTPVSDYCRATFRS
ncbi:hypothetical protein ABIF65_001722 [Bradyrhizobium japonicum]|jgi:hypothetical protein|nr:hypothetical protein [Bradyrhizobium japonicum]MCP1778449.1 hypothetical protein [Bradyrhizobium japonicum]MCP1857892.1 hypothetical protein [Bradyrhizobium japonicum]MCP1888706.1 hypothetical protein [Bradyrhizobium japonicum]MCP1958553.1 hypothetical protein [Bradyrhizobium japonicum]